MAGIAVMHCKLRGHAHNEAVGSERNALVSCRGLLIRRSDTGLCPWSLAGTRTVSRGGRAALGIADAATGRQETA